MGFNIPSRGSRTSGKARLLIFFGAEGRFGEMEGYTGGELYVGNQLVRFQRNTIHDMYQCALIRQLHRRPIIVLKG